MSKKQIVKNPWEQVKIVTHNNSGEQITQPNQSMSIREILFRNTQGMTYDNYKTPYYEDQATFSTQALNKIQEMEPVEKLQYLKEVSSQVQTLTKKIKDHEAQKAEMLKAQAEAVEVKTETKETESV
jgi:hypothetical protein